MSTPIILYLGAIQLDWSQGYRWTNFDWLFPPGSVTHVDPARGGGREEKRLAYRTTLSEALFRIDHLGFSLPETRRKFIASLSKWNRNANLTLTFDHFRDVLADIDVPAIEEDDLKEWIWDFRTFLAHRFKPWDTDDARLEDFIRGLETPILLRVLAERVGNQEAMLVWRHQDFVDAGWAAPEDFDDIDRNAFMASHSALVGRLQDHSQQYSISDFDSWLVEQGIPLDTRYVKLERNGAVTAQTLTLPAAVRNTIHHPENAHNDLADKQLRASVEVLLELSRSAFGPGPDIRPSAAGQ